MPSSCQQAKNIQRHGVPPSPKMKTSAFEPGELWNGAKSPTGKWKFRPKTSLGHTKRFKWLFFFDDSQLIASRRFYICFYRKRWMVGRLGRLQPLSFDSFLSPGRNVSTSTGMCVCAVWCRSSAIQICIFDHDDDDTFRYSICSWCATHPSSETENSIRNVRAILHGISLWPPSSWCDADGDAGSATKSLEEYVSTESTRACRSLLERTHSQCHGIMGLYVCTVASMATTMTRAPLNFISVAPCSIFRFPKSS